MASDTENGDASRLAADDTEERAPNTFFNALVGAAVSVVLGFIPFSPILGGGVAGYLDGGDTQSGARVGALAGLLASIPFALLAVLALAFFIIVPEGGAVGLSLGLVAIVLVIVTYTVGLSVIGAILGVYLNNEV